MGRGSGGGGWSSVVEQAEEEDVADSRHWRRGEGEVEGGGVSACLYSDWLAVSNQ